MVCAGDVRVGVMEVEVAHRHRATVHLFVLLGAHEYVGRRVRIAGAVGDHPALRLVVILEEEGRDRSEDEMAGAQRAQMRVERAEGVTHHDLARRLEVDLREERGRIEVRLVTIPLKPDKFGFPAGTVHEIDKGFEAALGARHWRDNSEQRHRRTLVRQTKTSTGGRRLGAGNLRRDVHFFRPLSS